MDEIPTAARRKKIVIGTVVAAVLFAVAVIAVIWQKSPKDIFDAAWKGDVKAVKRFLDGGINPNSLNEVKDIPLHLAKTREVAELLLSKGSKVDQPNGFGGTPLHMAAIHGRPQVAALLIEHGANVNALDIVGGTPLDHALLGRENKVSKGDYETVIKLLQSKGAVARQYPEKLK